MGPEVMMNVTCSFFLLTELRMGGVFSFNCVMNVDYGKVREGKGRGKTLRHLCTFIGAVFFFFFFKKKKKERNGRKSVYSC